MRKTNPDLKQYLPGLDGAQGDAPVLGVMLAMIVGQ